MPLRALSQELEGAAATFCWNRTFKKPSGLNCPSIPIVWAETAPASFDAGRDFVQQYSSIASKSDMPFGPGVLGQGGRTLDAEEVLIFIWNTTKNRFRLHVCLDTCTSLTWQQRFCKYYAWSSLRAVTGKTESEDLCIWSMLCNFKFHNIVPLEHVFLHEFQVHVAAEAGCLHTHLHMYMTLTVSFTTCCYWLCAVHDMLRVGSACLS